MERIDLLNSTLLVSAGWIDGMLEVEFRSNGEIWRYPTVDRATYDEMMSLETPSAGSYFMRKIRPLHIGEQQ